MGVGNCLFCGGKRESLHPGLYDKKTTIIETRNGVKISAIGTMGFPLLNTGIS